MQLTALDVARLFGVSGNTGPDGRPAGTRFVMTCPTVHDYLRLLARLANLLARDSFRVLLGRHAARKEFLATVQRAEQMLAADRRGSG